MNTLAPLSSPEAKPSFERARYMDATVHAMLKAGCSLDEIVGQLSFEKERLLAELVEVYSYAPRRIVTPEGMTMSWHCPTDLIPITQLGGRS